MNPKDSAAQCKVDPTLLPDVGVFHGAHAMMDGAAKYGPYNWRDKKIGARVYVAAARRHLASWLAREETAADSGAHHLGHAIACCAILLDAQEHDCLLDDRPPSTRMASLLERIRVSVECRKAKDARITS